MSDKPCEQTVVLHNQPQREVTARNNNSGESLHLQFRIHIEGKIYSQTDIISDRRLQRSKHGSNCARLSEQQDMLALG